MVTKVGRISVPLTMTITTPVTWWILSSRNGPGSMASMRICTEIQNLGEEEEEEEDEEEEVEGSENDDAILAIFYYPSTREYQSPPDG